MRKHPTTIATAVPQSDYCADESYDATAALALLTDLGEMKHAIADELRRSVSAVRLILGRLSSFELSMRPMTPSQLHRIELLQDAREGIALIVSHTDRLQHLITEARGPQLDAVPGPQAPLALGSKIWRMPTAPADSLGDLDDEDDTNVHPITTIRRSRILIVHDDRSEAASLALDLAEHDITVASSAIEALEIVGRDHRFDLVLCELTMSGTCGLDVYAQACATSRELAARFVFIADPATATRAADLLRATDPSHAIPEMFVGSQHTAADLRAIIARQLRR